MLELSSEDRKQRKKPLKCKEATSFIKTHLKYVFGKKPEGHSQDNLDKILKYKTWCFHTLYSLFKLYNLAAGLTTWNELPKLSCADFVLKNDSYQELDAEKEGLCMALNYDRSFVESIHSPISTILKALTIISIVLDVLIIKWRPLVHLCLIVDITHEVLRVMIPSPKTAYKMNFFLVAMQFMWAAFYTNKGFQVIYTVILTFLQIFVSFTFVLGADDFLTIGGFVKLMFWLTIFFVAMCG